MNATSETYFAPPERESQQVVMRQHAVLLEQMDLSMFDACPAITMVLNPSRQIIGCNKALVEMLDNVDRQGVYGLRPGELIKCAHSNGPGGCGTSEECAQCGAIKAVIGASTGRDSEHETGLLINHDGAISAFDVKVSAAPIKAMGPGYTLVFMEDIGPLNRKVQMERIFFHDAMNMLSSLFGAVELLRGEVPEKSLELIHDLHDRLKVFHHEIENSKKLGLAEVGQLEPFVEEFDLVHFLEKTVRFFSGTRFSENKTVNLVLNNIADDTMFQTEKSLLSRVVLNLLKNALEASQEHETVTVSARMEEVNLEISVHNTKVMASTVQNQIFHRSFSTKGSGRGLGTFGAKMLTENYLKGSLSFTSTSESGTIFTVNVPPLAVDGP